MPHEKGLGAVLSQEDNTSKVCLMTYASRMLRPSNWSMHNCSLAKIELLALNWTVTEKLWDYLLGQCLWYTQIKFP